jgi:hypothetical protein
VDVAVDSSWFIERIRRSAAAALTKTVNAVADGFLDRKAAEVRELIPRLAASPGEVVQKLRTSREGILYMLGQLDIIDGHLQSHYGLEPSQRQMLIRCYGHDPKEILTSVTVNEINVACLGARHGHGVLSSADLALILGADRPSEIDTFEYERRLALWLPLLPSIEQGHAALKGFVSQLQQMLSEQYTILEYREERNLALDIEGAKAGTDPAGMNRLRYETAQVRTLKGAFK